MEDEKDLDLDVIEEQEKLETKNRIQKLSEKVKTSSMERDEALAKAREEAEARAKLEKERDFFKSFSQISSKHPEAAQFQDQILERVNKGYDPEEAAIAVLAKEGKLGQMPEMPITQSGVQAEGGSAPTTFSGERQLSDMTPEEKLAALAEADKTGALFQALRGR